MGSLARNDGVAFKNAVVSKNLRSAEMVQVRIMLQKSTVGEEHCRGRAQ